MQCTDVHELATPFLHGELSPGEMRGVQMHLRGCLPCRRSVIDLRRTQDVVAPFYFVALAHGEITEDEQRAVEAHLAYCEACVDDRQRLQAASNELTKNLSQYELPRIFRLRVMQAWKPHRVGRRTRYNQRGLADLIERAEAGNTFSYERHVDRFKDYAYIGAFLEVKDFHWAGEIARRIFIDGMPVFKGELTQGDFLTWLRERAAKLSRKGGWLGEDDEVGDTGDGLSGYTGSRKLRRHRLVLGLHEQLDDAEQIPFLLYYVARMGYAEIASLLEIRRSDVMDILERTTRQAADALAEDDRSHPRRRHIWER